MCRVKNYSGHKNPPSQRTISASLLITTRFVYDFFMIYLVTVYFLNEISIFDMQCRFLIISLENSVQMKENIDVKSFMNLEIYRKLKPIL